MFVHKIVKLYRITMYDTDNIFFFDGHPSKDTMDCTTVYVS